MYKERNRVHHLAIDYVQEKKKEILESGKTIKERLEIMQQQMKNK